MTTGLGADYAKPVPLLLSLEFGLNRSIVFNGNALLARGITGLGPILVLVILSSYGRKSTQFAICLLFF